MGKLIFIFSCCLHKRSVHYFKMSGGIAGKSLHCPENQAELETQLFKVVSSSCVVTRDALNRPTITGGSFQEMCEMNGYLTGTDRFWSTYFLVRIMAGQLSTIIGPNGIPSDSYIHIQDYADQDYMDQYAKFSNITKVAMVNFIAGFNRRIDELNNGQAPMPAQVLALTIMVGEQPYPYIPTHITLLDFIRFGYHVTSDYSPQKIGLNGVLSNFAQIENLMTVGGYSEADAKSIVSDLFNTGLQRANGIVAENANTSQLPCSPPIQQNFFKEFIKSSISRTDVSNANMSKKKQPVKQNDDKSNISKKIVKQNTNKESTTIADYLKKFDEITAFRRGQGVNCPTQDKLESYSFVVSGEHTETGEAMVVVGPQINVSSIPGFEFNCDMINDELKFKHVVLGHLFGSMGVFGRNGYHYATSSVLGSLPGVAALLEDPSEDIFVRNATFNVRFGAPVSVPVYKSPHKGFVIQQGITSSLFEGPRSLVARNLDYGDEIQFFDTYFLAQFAESIDQLHDTIRGPGWSTGMDIFIHGADNQGHTFIGERAGWYDFGSSDIIPQGVLGESIPDGSTIAKRSGYFVVDAVKGYSAEWNSAVVQNMPSVYGGGEVSRVQWMEKGIEDIISVRKFKESDIRDLLIKIGNSAQGPSTISNSQEYWSDTYHWLFKNRFTQAVQAYSNPTRSTADSLLSTFEGGVVDGDNDAVISSLNIQDGWMLAQQWVWEVQAAIIQDTFGDAWANFYASSDKSQAAGTYYNNTLLGLVARVLGVSNVQNSTSYPYWSSNVGDVDLLIVEALDRALSTLGGLTARPWGENKRPVTKYTDAFFGQLPFVCNTVPVANRAGVYMSAVFDNTNGVDIKSICQIGQNETILFTPYPTVMDTAQQCDYVSWNLKPLKTLSQNK